MSTQPADAELRRRGPLVGRERELQAVEDALARLSRDRSGWLVLSGEPGVGKTRLLGELLDRAGERGQLVLIGRGAELEQEMPFGVWVDALDDYVASIGRERLERLVGDRVAELAWVLPSVRAVGEPPGVALQGERYRAHRAVRFLIQQLAAQRPVVLALDDLHWADDASLELVAHLLRRPVRGSVLVAIAFRAGQLPSWLAGPLESAARVGVVSDVAVEPLSAAQADELLGEGIGAAVRARLHALAGGNPFYLEQLAVIASHGPAAFLDAGELVSAPDAVAAALGQLIAGLSEGARLLAWGAAVAGEPVDLELAAATAGIGEDTAVGAFDELLREHLLTAAGAPCRYRFRHPIVRSAVYESAGAAWRLRAHARAAAAVAVRRGSAAARAHHVERCASVGDEQAIAVLVQAGREAAPRAPAGAARWFTSALRLLNHDPDAAPRRLELLIGAADALVAAGRLEEGLVAVLEALALVPASQGAVRARLIGACACCENMLGRHDAAHARLLRALAELDDLGSLDAAALQIELAIDAVYDGDFRAALDLLARARETARAHDDSGLTAIAAALACLAHCPHCSEEAELARAEVTAALSRMDDVALAERLDALFYLGVAEFFCGRYDAAIGLNERGIAVSRSCGRGQYLVLMMVGLAQALVVRGRLAEATETAEGAVEAARLAGNPQNIGWALVTEAWTAAVRGDVVHAVRGCDEALASIERLDESLHTSATREAAAWVFIEVGETERFLAQARRLGAPDFPRMDRGRRSWMYALLAQAECSRGGRAAAGDWLDRAQRIDRELDLPFSAATIPHACAALMLADGRPHDAIAAAGRAIERADGVGATLDAARARILLGRALGRAGRREQAVGLLRETEAQLASCGAQRLRDEAARELRLLGRRPAARQRRRAGGAGLDALSGREREIADLVARGHTNRTIAAQLFLSTKTVEGHLTNVFAKLCVGSRAEVAEAIGRARGLV